jgi:hypothetical protein
MLAAIVLGCQPAKPEPGEARRRLEKPMDQGSRGDEWPPEVIEKVNRDRVAREAVQRRHPGLFAAVSGAMFRHDPIGINFGNNTDEYDAEAGTVIPRLSACASADDVEKVLKEEFSRWFGADIAGRARYTALAKEVWRLWNESQAEQAGAADRSRD